MSNRARRILAIAICVLLGGVLLSMGMARAGRAELSDRLVGVALMAASLFLLLCAVGLAKPWIQRRGSGPGGERASKGR